MSSIPDKIWYGPETETLTTGSSCVLRGDVEYIRNDAEALGNAGWVRSELFWDMEKSCQRALENHSAALEKVARLIAKLTAAYTARDELRAQSATARNDALEEVVAKVEKSVSQGVNREKLGDYIRAMKKDEK